MNKSVFFMFLIMPKCIVKTSFFCLLFLSFTAPAAALESLVVKNPKQAILELNQKLEKDPEDKQSLFLKARAYENLGDVDTASKTYRSLIKRFPEQPESYLNLANIYSKKGNFKAAREVLEQGFSSNKVYSELYQNLKSLNRHLASQAYQRAMNKKPANEAPKFAVARNLSLPQTEVREVIKEVKVPFEVIKEVEVIREVIKEVRVPVEVIKEIRVPVNTTVQSSSASAVTSSTSSTANVSSISSSVEPANNPQGKTANVIENVRSWAGAWSDRNVSQYVSFYAPNYSTNRKNRSQWIADRKIKIGNKKFIEVKVSDFSQNLTSNGLVRVRFVQSYRSNTVFDTVRKELTFKKFPSGWKIVGERIVGR
jgi:tetratricopeptide (TPR) repeat protein